MLSFLYIVMVPHLLGTGKLLVHAACTDQLMHDNNFRYIIIIIGKNQMLSLVEIFTTGKRHSVYFSTDCYVD